ncbi:MAG TPA: hypothetical protein VF467_04800 [Afipia sp.]
MARALQNFIFGFLSTAIFFAAFVAAGDILIAALSAITVTIVQFVLRRTSQQKTGILMWASLAIVLTLTGISMMGDDEAFAVTGAVPQINKAVAECSCNAGPFPLPVRTTFHPSRDI